MAWHRPQAEEHAEIDPGTTPTTALYKMLAILGILAEDPTINVGEDAMLAV